MKQIGKWILIDYFSKSKTIKKEIRASFLAKDTDSNKICALTILNKKYNKDKDLIDEIKYGVKAYASLGQSDNLLKAVEYHELEQQIVVVNSYMPASKPLKVWLAKGFVFKEAEIIELAKQLFKTLKLSQKKGVTFGNLTPTFILYDPDTVQAYIATLPLKRSEVSSFLSMVRIIGSPNYRPPEFFMTNGKPCCSEDVYACFMILYNICSGKQAFEETKDFGAACMSVVNKSVISLPQNTGLSTTFKKLIEKGLKKEKQQRILDPDEIVEELNKLTLRNIPIISPLRLQQIVKYNYPTPIAHQFRLAYDDALDLSFRIKQLEIAIMTALQLLGTIVLCSEENHLSLIETRNQHLRRATLGQWLAVIRAKAKEMKQSDKEYWTNDFINIFTQKQNKNFDVLISWRNSVAHDVQNDINNVSELLETGLKHYWDLCRQITFITRYKLIYVEYLKYEKGKFLTKFIEFKGKKSKAITKVLNKPLPSSVLLCDINFENYINLDGLIRYETCTVKNCSLDDLFFYQSIRRNNLRYFSFHRGHIFTESL